jgi:hypothetical protein
MIEFKAFNRTRQSEAYSMALRGSYRHLHNLIRGRSRGIDYTATLRVHTDGQAATALTVYVAADLEVLPSLGQTRPLLSPLSCT